MPNKLPRMQLMPQLQLD